jgi:hypothetical protein
MTSPLLERSFVYTVCGQRSIFIFSLMIGVSSAPPHAAANLESPRRRPILERSRAEKD